MPLKRKWSKYNGLNLPNQIGIYELGYNKRVIYIGEGDIADRIARHDQRGMNFTHVRYEITNSKRRAGQRERAELRSYKKKHGGTPKYNEQDPSL
jgi:hypothetical protein